MEEALLRVGKVVKTQGLKGEVRVFTGGEKPETFYPGNVVVLEGARGERRSLTVRSSRTRRQMTILSFREITGIAGAEPLVGCEVLVAKESLEALPPGEFYRHQLLGLQVRTDAGVPLGTLEEIFSTGSNDVFVVRKDGREALIPATDEVVEKVDLEGKALISRPLEGMLPDDF